MPSAISPWMPKATVAIEDRRFYQHGGDRPDRDPPGARGRRERGAHRPGRLHDHAGARPQPLPLAPADAAAEGRRGLPRGQARAHLVEGPDPHRVPERRLLRQPRLRDRGRGRDVLLGAREPADARAGGASRGAAAGSVLLRPAARSGCGARAAKRGAAGAAAERRHHRRAVRRRDPRPQPPPAPERGVRERGAVLRRLRRGPAGAGLRRSDRTRRRAEDLHDDPAAAATRRSARAVGGVARPARPGRHDRLDRSRDGRHPRDGRSDARRGGQRVQPRHDGRASGRLDLQADRPHRRGGGRDEPVGDALPLRAVLLRAAPVARPHVRRRLRRAGDGRGGDAAVGQHRLCAARARRRPGRDRLDGAEARRADRSCSRLRRSRSVPAR